jgi:hypothetical protein
MNSPKNTPTFLALSGAALIAFTSVGSAAPLSIASGDLLRPAQTQIQDVAYRHYYRHYGYYHHYRHYGYYHRYRHYGYYHHRYYGYNPGAAVAGAALGVLGLGIGAATLGDCGFYGCGYGYGYGPSYGYYGGPYYGGYYGGGRYWHGGRYGYGGWHGGRYAYGGGIHTGRSVGFGGHYGGYRGGFYH